MDQPISESMSLDQAVDMYAGLVGNESAEVPNDPIEGAAEVEQPEGEVESPEGETEQSDESETAQTPEELSPIESLADIAQALEQPLETVLDNLKATVKVNGVEEAVNLRELINGYQKDADYRRKTSEFAEQRRQVEQKVQQDFDQIGHQHMVLGRVMQQVQQLFVGNPEQLEQLRQTNPEAYNQARWELADRQQRFQAMMQEAANAYAQGQQSRSAQTADQLQKIRQQEFEALQSRIPDWSDQTRVDLSDYLGKAYGYSEGEIGQIMDHRAIDIARKAMLYDAMQSQADVAKAKVKTLPKLQKAAPQRGLSVNQANLSNAKKRFAKSRKLEDAVNLLSLR